MTQSNESARTAFWSERMANLPVLNLGLDRPRSAIRSYMRSTESIRIEATVASSLVGLAPGGSAFAAIGAAVAAVLSRHSGQSELVLGTVAVSGDRGRVVPIRLDLDGDPDPGDLAGRVSEEVAAVAQAPQASFEDLMALAGVVDDGVRGALFQAMFVLCDEAHELSPQAVEEDHLFDAGEQISNCDVVFVARRSGTGEIGIDCDFDTDVLEVASVRRLVGHLSTLITDMASTPTRALSRLALMDKAEREDILKGFNETARDYPRDATLQSLFEAQVAKTPDAPALIFGETALTYRELNARANRLAHHLRRLGVGPDVLVGVYMERSVEMVVALYGVIKAGGAYVPIDPEYPADRVGFMLEDCVPPVVLTQAHLRAALGELDATVIALDEAETLLEGEPDTNPEPTAGPAHLAYVIFTSGSTGRPKGAMNEHRGICNRLLWMQDEYGLTAEDRVAQKTPYSFDVSVWEFFWPLQTGAALIMAEPGGHRDPGYLVDTIIAHQITTLHFVPSMLQLFLEEPRVPDCASLKRVICSGEALPHELQERFFARLDCELHNLYGPTEAAVDVTYWACRRDDRLSVVPIGRPVANTQIYILDEHLQPVPAQVAGELHIGGVQVARGYLNRPELDAERFIADPFADDAAAKLYKTGDLARFGPDGVIEYLGRIDHQVKLRGFRIELGEIEALLDEQESVRESVVVLREDVAGDPRLVAYVVARQGMVINAQDLDRQLRRALPDFMVPSTIVALDAMPLSANGKVDRNALPAPAKSAPTTSAIQAAVPRQSIATDGLEDRIAAIWRDLLQRSAVSIDDNFFDLGGHSLLLAKMRVQLRDAFGTDLAMTTLFRYPTVRTLAAHLSAEIGESGKAAHASGAQNRARDNDIAIIGLACRLPGAQNADAFWRNIEAGVESVRFFTPDELAAAGISREAAENPDYVPARAILGDVDKFDAAFFGYSPREAETMDPQQRLFLETAWHAFEDSGYDPGAIAKPVGVFAGSGMNTYVLKNLNDPSRPLGAVGEFQRMISNDKDFLATRVAYKLDLKGPAINVQTACSTSLVAVHMAARSLIDGECDVALAGGVSVSLPEVEGYAYQEGMILSPDGHCRAFDADARGTVFGNGVAAVVVKRLSDAIADGDTIRAVIKGTAINNDGSQKIGYTAPGVEGQSSVITRAQEAAGVEPASIGYVEAHGTGTPLGDPIEVAALTEAFRRGTDETGFCGLGSLKTNIGHVDAAAGAAGLIKAVLALEHKRRPPSLHFKAPNPEIDFEASPFYVVQRAEDWPDGKTPRRAGVSSFGIGGTNAHVVVEEAPALAEAEAGIGAGIGAGTGSQGERPAEALCLSAKTPAALGEMAGRWAAFVRSTNAAVGDIAFTAGAGRAHFAHRLAATGADAQEISAALASFAETGSGPGIVTGEAPAGGRRRIAFLFTGQGSQRAGMGRALYDTQPVFRAAIERCNEILAGALERPLIDVMFAEGDEARLIDQTAYTQPALFALEWALAELWRSFGVVPSVVMGHSVGEFVAATGGRRGLARRRAQTGGGARPADAGAT